MTNDQASRIAGNLRRVHDRIAAALARAGRPADAARLIAVTKYADDAQLRALYDAGQRAFGESRLLQAESRIDRLHLPDAEWHMIGHIQRNKARHALHGFALVHSVDSARLLRKIATEAAGERRAAPLPILLQFNPAREESKSGFLIEEAEAAFEAAADVAEHVRVEGLMCMAPFTDDSAPIRAAFRALRELRDRFAAADRPLRELSMGMSNDFEIAVEEGATLVRVGSALLE